MKVAVCFSGQARFAKENYQHTYDNLIAPLNADVFCHFWSTEDPSQGMDPNVAVELYKPIDWNIEEQVDFSPLISNFSGLDEWRVKRMLSMYYSMRESIRVSENWARRYDVVVKARTDLIFQHQVDPAEFVKNECLWFYDSRLIYYREADEVGRPEKNKLRLYGDEIFWGVPPLMRDLTERLFSGCVDCCKLIPRPEFVMAEVLADLGGGKIRVSSIGQPNIRRNQELHTKRLESLGRGEVPKKDD